MHDVEQSGVANAQRVEPMLVDAERAESAADVPPENLPRRYLALVAGITERLLASDAGSQIAGDLFEIIRSELRLDVFVNYRFEDGRLVLEAHGGLSAAEAGAVAILEMGQAVCGCVARDRAPIHATAVQASEDPLHGFIKGMRLDAYACTPLVHGDELLGTLSFGRRWADRFSEDELSFLHTVCHYIALAKHRARAEQELREGVEYRERLLGELNHRVRNALQLAIGLVSIDAGGAEPAAARALRRAGDRLEVLAAAHRPLYATARPDRIDLLTLLRCVVDQSVARPVAFVADGECELPVERAVALALLTHELLSTELDCDADAPQIALRNDPAGNDRIRLEFSGMMSGVQDRGAARSRMVEALARQLRATIDVGASDGVLIVAIPDTARE